MLKSTKKIGDEAEEKAKTFLESRGFCVLEQNYRHRKSEIDIIAKKDEVIHFVEVKYRSNIKFGFPEEFVDETKAEMIAIGAEQYLEINNWNGHVQYDIISIIKNEILFFEDAF